MNQFKRNKPLETEPVFEIGDTFPSSGDAPEDVLPHPGHSISISEQFWSLDPRNIRLDRIGGLIFSAVVLVVFLVVQLILWINLGFDAVWFGVGAGALVLTAVSFWLALYWPAVAYRHASWRLDEEGLEIRRGVFWRHQITIPLGRVQHADVSQGPLQRTMELGTLTVNTAGTQNASVQLEGLAHSTAIALRDQIVRQRKDQHVV